MTRSSISTTATLPGTGGRRVEGFIAERSAAWAELVDLLGRARGRVERLPGDDALRLGDLYRATTADLARARQRWPGDPVVGELEALVGRARTVVYRVPGRRASFGHWLGTGFFRRVRERPRVLLVAALLLWGPALGTGLWAHADPATAGRVAAVTPLTQGASDAADRGGPATTPSDLERTSMGSQIFVNNIRVSFMALAVGIAGGLPTALLLAFNGAIVGLVAGLFAAAGAGDAAISLLAPHGFIELSLVTVAGAAGLRLGIAVVAPGLRARGAAVVEEARAAAEVALGVALWLVPTGLVEGLVTTRHLPPATAVAVGLSLAGLFWALVWWRGRPAGDQSRAVALASR
ncbi:MAG TPA: stage II sporulation protein M [Iamia sp.]|nr:stage II sporulation protein M [Iamia sp.]